MTESSSYYRHCQNCGTILNPESKFCHNCGEKIRKNQGMGAWFLSIALIVSLGINGYQGYTFYQNRLTVHRLESRIEELKDVATTSNNLAEIEKLKENQITYELLLKAVQLENIGSVENELYLRKGVLVINQDSVSEKIGIISYSGETSNLMITTVSEFDDKSDGTAADVEIKQGTEVSLDYLVVKPNHPGITVAEIRPLGANKVLRCVIVVQE